MPAKRQTLKQELDYRFGKIQTSFEKGCPSNPELKKTLDLVSLNRQNFRKFDAYSLSFGDKQDPPTGKQNLLQSLIDRYKSLPEELRDLYVLDYFKATQEKLLRCPVCGKVLDTKKQTEVLQSERFALKVELDHLLPKNKYPQFSLCLENLIPICHECNHNKGDNFKFQDLQEFYSCLQSKGFIKNIESTLTPLPFISTTTSSNASFLFTFTILQIYRNLSINPLFWEDIGSYRQQLLGKSTTIFAQIQLPADQKLYEWLSAYGLPERMERIAHSCLESLLQQLRNAQISGPDGLWQHLEYLANSNFEEFNSGYPTHPYIQVWQDLLDWCLAKPEHVASLWEEVVSRPYSR